MRRSLFSLALGALGALSLAGCHKEGCLAGDDAKCVVPAPCPDLGFSCAGGFAEARVIQAGDTVPGGPDALGTIGDILIGNDRVVGVVDAISHPTLLGPTGGSLLDLGNRGANDDNINQIIDAVGILPGDAVHWNSLEILSSGPGVAAVQVRGTLDGRARVKVAKRYEVRACEPGIRMRTEIVNRSPDTELWAVSDGYYWSGKEALPFTPYENGGFHHDAFDLLTINDAFRRFPYLAWSAHAPPYASYASVACNSNALEGFNSEQISTAGLPLTIVRSGDYQVFERFIGVAPRGDAAGGADLALDIRSHLFKEKMITVRGRIVRTGGVPIGAAEAKAAVLIAETPSDDAPVEKRMPWTEIAPGADGVFTARIPAKRRYAVDVHAFGQVVLHRATKVDNADVDLGDLEVPLVGRLDITLSDAVTALPMDGRVVLTPADGATGKATSGKLFGQFTQCAPLLGPPHGSSPACNQVLVRGNAQVEVPSGKYHVFATGGLFTSVGHQIIDVGVSPIPVSFALTRLPLLPTGTLSADLHVHGRSSFDSSIPDLDRVLAIAAAGLDVIAATDHDVIESYASAVQALGLSSQLAVMPGLETTGHILWFKNPGSTVPRVIGHYNFWPLQPDPSLPRRGAPYDELIDPGVLFDRVRPLFTSPGVVELNHPWAPPEFGRDLGFPRAIALNCNKPLPDHDDGSAAARFIRTPAGAHSRNDSHDAQEVMNGSDDSIHLQYRALWFCFLNQGKVYAGTANSDSHGLSDNAIGTPRNIVWANTAPGASFAPEVFNAAVRGGHIVGTNGPVIEARIKSGSDVFQPSVTAIVPAANATLAIQVRAAPWIPVSEVRIVVNGAVAKTLAGLPQPADPFGTLDLDRLNVELPLSDILPSGNKDAWIVVEAGEPIALSGDLDNDGIPDTGDNNGDGVVDKRDIASGETVGPLKLTAVPDDFGDRRYPFAQLSMGGLPHAFTNPFILDRDGNGFSGPGIAR